MGAWAHAYVWRGVMVRGQAMRPGHVGRAWRLHETAWTPHARVRCYHTLHETQSRVHTDASQHSQAHVCQGTSFLSTLLGLRALLKWCYRCTSIAGGCHTHLLHHMWRGMQGATMLPRAHWRAHTRRHAWAWVHVR